MSFEDFFQAEILLWSDWVALVYSLLNLIPFHMNTLTFPWEIEKILIIIILIGVLSLLSQLETPVSLAVDYSKYLGIVTGGTSNWLEYPLFLRLRHKNNTVLTR